MRTINLIKSQGRVNPITLEATSNIYKSNHYNFDEFKDNAHKEHVLNYIESESEDLEESKSPVALTKKTYSYVLTPEGRTEKQSNILKIHEDGTYEYYSVDSNKESKMIIE